MDLEKYQVKSITPVDNYICELSDELKELARVEFGETEEIRNNSIKSIRDWVLENPRIIKTRLDSKFILRFLRYRKYDLEKTKESIERWVVMFKIAGFELKWFSPNYDITKLHMKDIIRNKLCVILPNNQKSKPTVYLNKLITFDPKIEGILKEVFTTAVLCHELSLEDEEIQIRGAVVIQDCSNASFRHAILLSVPTWYKILRNIEKGFNGRIKEIHIFNLPTALRFLAKIVLSNFSEKLNSRIHIHSNAEKMVNCEELKNVNFPEEFGGTLNYEELGENMIKLMEQKRELFIKYDDLKIDYNLYPPEVLNLNVDCLDKNIEAMCKDMQSKVKNGN